jgi:hypothetical protein
MNFAAYSTFACLGEVNLNSDFLRAKQRSNEVFRHR